MKIDLSYLIFVESVNCPILFVEIMNGSIDFSQATKKPNSATKNK